MGHTLTIDPAPGEGRWLALALVNTELESRRRPIDLLDDAAAVQSWLASHGVIDDATSVRAADLHRFHALRAAVRSVFAAAVEHMPPEGNALAVLNAVSAAVPGMRQLAWDAAHPVGRWHPAAGLDPIDIALASIAADAMELLLDEDRKRLSACGAHGCVRMFVQEHARRRWCSRTCGDRVRVARHYEKTHLDADSSSLLKK